MPNGLAISRRFFEAARPLLEDSIPDVMACSAAGLVGEGSECLGLDDAISRDHDWGPSFCLWVPEDVLRREGARIEDAMSSLPARFEGHPARMGRHQRMGRVGPLPLEGFYRRFLGQDHAPRTWQAWRSVPEYHLCSCTNGEVFHDPEGRFSAVRDELLAYYPDDVYLKKVAARCMIMAQAGQYNLPRSLQRGDTVAAMLAAARFSEAALSMVFLLNRRYMPFYKWAGRMASALPGLGSLTAETLRTLSRTAWDDPGLGVPAVEAVERLCTLTADELRRRALTDEQGSWLWALGPSIQRKIQDPELRRLNVMED